MAPGVKHCGLTSLVVFINRLSWPSRTTALFCLLPQSLGKSTRLSSRSLLSRRSSSILLCATSMSPICRRVGILLTLVFCRLLFSASKSSAALRHCREAAMLRRAPLLPTTPRKQSPMLCSWSKCTPSCRCPKSASASRSRPPLLDSRHVPSLRSTMVFAHLQPLASQLSKVWLLLGLAANTLHPM